MVVRWAIRKCTQALWGKPCPATRVDDLLLALVDEIELQGSTLKLGSELGRASQPPLDDQRPGPSAARQTVPSDHFSTPLSLPSTYCMTKRTVSCVLVLTTRVNREIYTHMVLEPLLSSHVPRPSILVLPYMKDTMSRLKLSRK